jgi:hypothetical protein
MNVITCHSCRYSIGAMFFVPESGDEYCGLACKRDGLEATKLCAYYEREPGADEHE